MAGTGSLTTDEAVRMSRFAEDVGADAVIVVPITYWPLTDNEVYEHYSRIAKAIKIPVVIYNNPGTTGVDIKPALLARLAEIDNIRREGRAPATCRAITRSATSPKAR